MPPTPPRRRSGSFMHELVRVGDKRIVGEIIKLEGDTASIQCYEDTSGLSVGDVVFRTQAPLSVELGPGIMDNIFDGIQRPLEVIFDQAGHSPFVPLGVDVPALDRSRKFLYRAASNIREGQQIVGGSIIGEVWENELMRSHKIMVPPEVYGEVVAVYHGGANITDRQEELTIAEPLIRIKHDETGALIDVKMYHQWPVRKPRPVAEKLPGKEALITGQRVIDVLFPSVLGGTCAIPGAFGCGKTCISQALSKYSNTSAIVYVGCGERGNEMAEVLTDFPELTTKVDGECGRRRTGQGAAQRVASSRRVFGVALDGLLSQASQRCCVPRSSLFRVTPCRQGGGHHEAHVPGGQHVQHARGRPRGLHLHRHLLGGVSSGRRKGGRLSSILAICVFVTLPSKCRRLFCE